MKKSAISPVWGKSCILEPSQSFYPSHSKKVTFQVNEEGDWSLHRAPDSLLLSNLELGETPVIAESGRPYYKPEWALSWAIAQKDYPTINRLLRLGAPLSSSCSIVSKGTSAAHSLLARNEKGLSVNKIEAYFKVALKKKSKSKIEDSDLKDFLMEALALKRLEVAELIWNYGISNWEEKDRLNAILSFLSPRAGFSNAYREASVPPNGSFEPWLKLQTEKWLDRIIPANFVFEKTLFCSVSVSKATDDSVADISFDPYGSLMFYPGSTYKDWRRQVFTHLHSHLLIDAVVWSCKSGGSRFSEYPTGHWSFPDLCRKLGMDDLAAEVEQEKLQALPSATPSSRPPRL